MMEEIKWTVDSVREWARDLFATRDEAARVARSEVRRESDREVARLDERIDREVAIRDKRFEELDRDMDRRLTEQREFRDEVVNRSLDKDQWEREHRTLETKHDSDIDNLDKRISALELMLANIQGKAVVYAIIGSIFLATVTALLTHLIGT